MQEWLSVFLLGIITCNYGLPLQSLISHQKKSQLAFLVPPLALFLVSKALLVIEGHCNLGPGSRASWSIVAIMVPSAPLFGHVQWHY
ncbi:hypothetical protein BGX38DRAFT_1186388, partial [Terfezia claveryi]